MQSQFRLNDDILAEVFGYLSGLDVLQCRRTCQRISRITREHFLWVTIYRRCTCPLPTLDLSSSSAVTIERAITRAETLNKIWTAPRPAILAVHDSVKFGGTDVTSNDTCIGVHGPYITLLRLPGRFARRQAKGSFCWYKIGDQPDDTSSRNPLFQYDFLPARNRDFSYSSEVNVGLACRMDPVSGVLHVASVTLDGRTIFVTSIGTGPNFQRKTQTFETSLQWKSGGFHGIKITDDFVYCCSTRRDEPQLVEFIHIPTGKRLCAFLRVERSYGEGSEEHKIEFVVISRYFIRILCSKAIEVFELPSLSKWAPNNSESTSKMAPTELRPSFSDCLPDSFVDIYVLPSSIPSSLVIVAAGDPDAMRLGLDYQVSLMSLDITQHKIRQVKELSMKGAASSIDRRLTLTYTPATQRAAGIVVTRSSVKYQRGGVAPFRERGVYQKLKYIQVSVDGEPAISVNELSVSPELAEHLGDYHYVDIFGGRIIWQRDVYSKGRTFERKKEFAILNYL